MSRVAEEALKVYLYLNLLVAVRENGADVYESPLETEPPLQNGLPSRHNYLDFASCERVLDSVTGTYDGDGQNLVHREFLLTESAASRGPQRRKRHVFANLDALREYLKAVWRIMVVYHAVICEAGGEPGWEENVGWVLESFS